MRELIRKIYYALFSGRVVTLQNPAALAGYKWIIDTKEGMAYRKGYYEPPVTQLILSKLSSDAVFFDLGAHVGYFSLLAAVAAPRGAVHSFEPDEANFSYCQAIRDLNQLVHWTVNKLAVGAKTETSRYRKGHTTTTGQVDDNGEYTIELTSLDDYIANKGLNKLDLVKIDVEGFGGNVLKGAVDTLKTLKPIILMEFHERYDEWEVFHQVVAPDYIIYDLAHQVIDDVVERRPHFVYAIPR